MTQFELIDTVEVGNTLGESVLWCERQQAVWWTDIHESRLHRYIPAQRDLTTYTLPERLTSFGFTEDEGQLICAFASGFALYRPESGEIHWLAQPEKHLPGNRFNDGRVDRQGRFWAGTMVERAADGVTGSLYRLAGRECVKILDGIQISNSICWSPDSSRFYFADSPKYRIFSYAFDSQAGIPSDPQIFASTQAPYEPDGSTVDAQGYLWNALWGGGKVVRNAPDGSIAETLHLPVSQPTCVAFGGRDLNLLLVTSARVGLSVEQLNHEPQAGNLFIYRTPFTGLTEARFRI
jgi:L-arabinonolactonase